MAAAWSLTGGLAGLDPVLPGAGAGGRRGLGLRPLDLRQLARRHVHVPDPPAGGRGESSGAPPMAKPARAIRVPAATSAPPVIIGPDLSCGPLLLFCVMLAMA